MARRERCGICGKRWAVSRHIDLTGKVYICPRCEKYLDRQYEGKEKSRSGTQTETAKENL